MTLFEALEHIVEIIRDNQRAEDDFRRAAEDGIIDVEGKYKGIYEEISQSTWAYCLFGTGLWDAFEGKYMANDVVLVDPASRRIAKFWEDARVPRGQVCKHWAPGKVSFDEMRDYLLKHVMNTHPLPIKDVAKERCKDHFKSRFFLKTFQWAFKELPADSKRGPGQHD